MDATDISIVGLDFETDPNLEPQPRARSNTWPLRPQREIDPQCSPVPSEEAHPNDHHDIPPAPDQHGKDPLGLTAKKSGSRRNAWGNLSYADLITKAITSSPEQRLTLSQIYDWMVQNVPYFKDKGDSTSSAGWKNSIRHNLSLHSRFMRIQNEGTGKSSWWILNPDAKPGKTPRRRAGSMETKSYEKKRGRVKKKIEALRAGLEAGTLSPGGSEDYIDSLAFGEFRQRASSNASSCGRLSPIHAMVEPDLHDNQVPPMSPIPWGTEMNNSPYGEGEYMGEPFGGVEGGYINDHHINDHLVDSLVDGMKLHTGELKQELINSLDDPYISGGAFNGQQPAFMEVEGSSLDGGQYSQLPAPPPYPKQQQQSQQPQLSNLDFKDFKNFQSFNSGLRLQNRTSPDNVGAGRFSQSDLINAVKDFTDLGIIKQDPDGPESQVQQMTGCQGNSLSINTQQQLPSPSASQQVSPNPGNPGLYARLSPQAPQVKVQGMTPGLTHQLNQQQQTRLLLQQQHQQQQQQQANNNNAAAAAQQFQLSQATQASMATQASILREALTRGPTAYRSPTTPTPPFSMNPPTSSNFSMGPSTPSPPFSPHMSPLSPPQMNVNTSNMMPMGAGGMTGGGMGLIPHHQLQSILESANEGQMADGSGRTAVNNNNAMAGVNSAEGVPSDIDFDLIQGLDFDMDSVIQKEISLEGGLDFNFDSNPNSNSQNVVH